MENIVDEKMKLLAYGYIAMLSDYLESSYTFKSQQNKYGQLYRFFVAFAYDNKLKVINDFTVPINFLLNQHIYDMQLKAQPAADEADGDADDTPVAELEIIGLKDKFKNLSKIKLTSNILGITFGEPSEVLQANNMSNFIGENKPSDDAKYFALQATKTYEDLLNKYKPTETVIKAKGSKEVRKIIKSFSQSDVLELLKQ